MSIFQALILGILQGLTEFIPVSSSAHLFLAQEIMGIRNDEMALAFDIVIHLGTALALIVSTWSILAPIVMECLRWIGRRPARDHMARGLILPLIIGTIPGALAGFFLLKYAHDLRSVLLVGITMILACGYFLLCESLAARAEAQARGLGKMKILDSIWIGLAQATAGLFPGFSRSGLTISTGRLVGLKREDAARFSFLLALPLILGAGAKTILDLRDAAGPTVGFAVLATGLLSAAIVGYLAVTFLLRFLRTHTLRPFAAYMGVLGLILIVFALGT